MSSPRKFATPAAAKKSGTPKSGNIPDAIRRMFPMVTRLVDATEPVEITVTPRDCNKAKQGDFTSCAMARAIGRQYEATGSVIGLSRSYVINGDTATRFLTPATVAREITSFDRNADFAPGNYHLAPMCPTNVTGASHKSDGGPDRRKDHHKGCRARVVHKATARVRSLSKVK